MQEAERLRREQVDRDRERVAEDRAQRQKEEKAPRPPALFEVRREEVEADEGEEQTHRVADVRQHPGREQPPELPVEDPLGDTGEEEPGVLHPHPVHEHRLEQPDERDRRKDSLEPGPQPGRHLREGAPVHPAITLGRKDRPRKAAKAAPGYGEMGSSGPHKAVTGASCCCFAVQVVVQPAWPFTWGTTVAAFKMSVHDGIPPS